MEGSNLTKFLVRDDVSGWQDAGLSSLLNYLVLTYFAHFFGVCFIRTKDDTLHHSVPVPTFVFELDAKFETLLGEAIEFGCQSFIVTEDGAGAFFDAFLPVHEAALQRSTGKRLLLVLRPNSSLFPTISQILVLEELPETLNILPTPCREEWSRFELYTLDLSEGDPVAIQPRLIDVVETGPEANYHNGIDHFPDPFVNMNKRRMRIGAIPYVPSVHVEDVPLGEGNARYILPAKENVSAMISGTEMWMAVLFCEIANCTTEIMIHSEWGYVFDNGTNIGLVGAPAKREVDITFAALYTWYSCFKHLAFTAVHGRDGCTCIVPKPRVVANWRTPFLSFSGSLWCAVLAAFVAGAFAVFLLSRSRQRILRLDESTRYTVSDSVLVMIGFFMEQTVLMPNELLASCCLFTTLMFAGFMIGSSYNGGLASTMIVPQYEPSINTVHDLAERRMAWVGITMSWIYSIQFAHQPDMLTLLDTFRMLDEEEIFRRAYDRDVAIIVERMEYGHFAHPDMDLEAMKGRKMLVEDIYWESVVAMSTKTWPGRVRFDRMVHDLKAYGILAYWELIGVAKFMSFKAQQIIRFSRESSGDEFKPLNVANITGALMVLGTGLSLATVVFLAEVLWHKFGPPTKRRFRRGTRRRQLEGFYLH